MTLFDRVVGALEARGVRVTTLVERERRGMRYVLRFWPDEGSAPFPRVRFELSTRGNFLHAYVATERYDDDLIASVAVPGAALWVGVDAVPRTWLAGFLDRLGRGRETGVHVDLPDADDSDLRVRWRTHSPADSWDNRTPWWRDGSVNVTDAVLGCSRYESHTVREEEVDVPMPERSYRWRIRLSDDVWTRPRWPWAHVVRRAHCDALPGEQIPIPGKGENPWDCGNDANFGLSTRAYSITDAVSKIAQGAIKTRLDRGWTWEYPPRGGEGLSDAG